MDEPVRKRIVINLDSPPVGPMARGKTKTSRWPKVLALLATFIVLGVVLALVGVFFWWRHFQTTPTYTVALLIDAAQRDDMQAFEKLIDDEEIAKNMIAAVAEKAAGRYGLALSGSVQTQIDRLLPTLQPKLKQTIHEEVAREIKEFASKSQPKPFPLIAVAVPSFVNITTNGDTAKASAALNNRTVEMTLKRDNDRWKVTEFKDDVLLQRVVDSVIKELPAIGGLDLPAQILKNKGRKPRRLR
jgi:hypothetical protein